MTEQVNPVNDKREHYESYFGDVGARVYQDNPYKRVPCMKTVYNLIDRGELDVRNIDLPRKTSLRPRRKKPTDPHGTNKRKLGRSIEERDPAVLTREAFGHWELDLVIGKKTKGEPVILTLLERQTRYYVTKKLWNKSPEYIREAMLKIIKEHGPQNFKTITTLRVCDTE